MTLTREQLDRSIAACQPSDLRTALEMARASIDSEHDRVVLLGAIQQLRILADGLGGALEDGNVTAATNSLKVCNEVLRQALKGLRVKA